MATGIGVTPFSSILQSIIFRYKAAQRVCPNCNYKWVMDLSNWMQQLKKVDFFWINRDQNSFEWFLKLLLEIENEQSEIESSSQQVCPEDKNLQGDGRFMNIHLYFTQALQSSDIRAVGMQLAMDLLRTKVLFWSISYKLLFILKKREQHKNTVLPIFTVLCPRFFFYIIKYVRVGNSDKGPVLASKGK